MVTVIVHGKVHCAEWLTRGRKPSHASSGETISNMFAERRGAVDGELDLENQADMDDLMILAMLTLLSEPWFNHL